jgi:hypothetical protein
MISSQIWLSSCQTHQIHKFEEEKNTTYTTTLTNFIVPYMINLIAYNNPSPIGKFLSR